MSIVERNIPVSFTAFIYLSLCLITISDIFELAPYLKEVSAALIILFVILEFKRIPAPQKISGTALILISLVFAFVSNEWRAIVIDGLSRTSVFLLLFYAISWLQFPVNDSVALGSIRSHITSQPAGKRFLYLAFGVHSLGSILNIAGLSFLTSVVEDEKNSELKRRLSVTLMLGFAAVSCWSPFFIGMIVVLVALPELNWSDFAPIGVAMAILLIFFGWLYDLWRYPKSKNENPNVHTKPFSLINFSKSIAILVILVGLTIGFVEGVGTNIPVALSIIGPPFSICWFLFQKKRGEDIVGRTAGLLKNVISIFPRFRNESLVFAAANMFGLGVSAVLPENNFSNFLNNWVPYSDLKLVILVIVLVGLSILGIHPVITVIGVTAVCPPSALGIDSMVIALTYLGCWGLSTSISPFSGTTLFMSRVTGEAAHVVGWSWMLPMALVGVTLVTLTVITVRHLLI